MFRQVTTILMAVLVASQPLIAIADTHLLHQSGVPHSPLDLLHNAPGSPDHHHKAHQFASVKITAEFVTTQDAASLDVEVPECGSCNHTHTTSRVLLSSATPVASLSSKQQNLHFYLSPQSFEHRTSPYRPPRF